MLKSIEKQWRQGNGPPQSHDILILFDFRKTPNNAVMGQGSVELIVLVVYLNNEYNQALWWLCIVCCLFGDEQT